LEPENYHLPLFIDENTSEMNVIMRLIKLLVGILTCLCVFGINSGYRQSGNQNLVKTDRNLPQFSEATPQLYSEFLIAVPDIQVETVVGYLPRLPRYAKGVYSNNFIGPDVRVIWPAPEDNSQVLVPGTYKVTGRVAGTEIHPNAIATAKEAEMPATPDRTLEAFNLDEVILNADINNHDTKFIDNRDKFMRGLANTNPDNFLYMFRNAFGQAQLEGAKAIGGDGIVSRQNCTAMPQDIISAQ
jgi:hypothetical protein